MTDELDQERGERDVGRCLNNGTRRSVDRELKPRQRDRHPRSGDEHGCLKKWRPERRGFDDRCLRLQLRD